MIGAGDRVPAVRVWLSAEDEEGVLVTELAEAGPFLLLFYLYDWTST